MCSAFLLPFYVLLKDQFYVFLLDICIECAYWPGRRHSAICENWFFNTSIIDIGFGKETFICCVPPEFLIENFSNSELVTPNKYFYKKNREIRNYLLRIRTNMTKWQYYSYNWKVFNSKSKVIIIKLHCA